MCSHPTPTPSGTRRGDLFYIKSSIVDVMTGGFLLCYSLSCFPISLLISQPLDLKGSYSLSLSFRSADNVYKVFCGTKKGPFELTGRFFLLSL